MNSQFVAEVKAAEGLDFGETGIVMGENPKTVDAACRQATTNLRQQLKPAFQVEQVSNFLLFPLVPCITVFLSISLCVQDRYLFCPMRCPHFKHVVLS